MCPLYFTWTHRNTIFCFFDLSKFDVTTIIERNCMKDQKQKAEFNLYIYIYILDFLIGDGDDISILKID